MQTDFIDYKKNTKKKKRKIDKSKGNSHKFILSREISQKLGILPYFNLLFAVSCVFQEQ